MLIRPANTGLCLLFWAAACSDKPTATDAAPNEAATQDARAVEPTVDAAALDVFGRGDTSDAPMVPDATGVVVIADARIVACGDGTCDTGETVASCGRDCGCRAVGSATQRAPAGCRCDAGCGARSDCCADACAAFGSCAGSVSNLNMHIYTHWRLDARSLISLDAPVRIDNDPAGQSFFWATTFRFTTEGGYIGLQTVGENGAKVARFSIWNSTRADTSTVGAACRNFDGEGVGKTCWVPFDWRAGETYTLRVERQPSGWWRGSVRTASTGALLNIGDIEGPPGGTNMESGVSAFTEYYGRSLPACSALNSADAFFAGPSGNGGSVSAVRTGSSVGASACVTLFSEVASGVRGGRHRVH